jgi:hypothetical protein
MLLSLLAAVVLSAPDLPQVCAPPPTREVGALTTLAQRSGALSVGLDSVATWCFDSGGAWTGGAPPPKKGKRREEPPPMGDCAKAITNCQQAYADITDELRALLSETLKDLERPYLGARYTPRRSGLAERPSEAAECSSHVRSALFTQAQARMDLARLAGQAQSEYSNYKTWLFTEGLKCADAVAKGVKDPTHKGISVDAPVSVDAGAQRVAQPQVVVTQDLVPDAGRAVSAAVPVPDAGRAPVTIAPVDAGRAVATTVDAGRGPTVVLLPTVDAGPATMVVVTALTPAAVEKWRALAAERAKLEVDPDWLTGFLSSRELRECHCARVDPSQLVRRLEGKEPLAEADEAKAARCESCLQDSFPTWKARLKKQCALMDQLTDFELGVLERSDDSNGLPPRCFNVARSKRAGRDAGVPVAPPVVEQPQRGAIIITRVPEAAPATGTTGTSATTGTTATGTPTTGTPTTGTPTTGTPTNGTPTNGTTTTATPATASTTGSPRSTVVVTPADPSKASDVPRPTDYAPIPAREEGRLYVRVFMSSACTAEIEPGPMQARTGDLLPVPIGAKFLSVKSACGGLVEVYWSKEPKPRVSETFGTNQPLRLEFK